MELKRGKQTYWIAATDDGLELKYQRKGKKRHQMAIEQGTMQCIGRITPPATRIEQDEPAGAGADMVGTWTAYDKKGRATEVRIASHSAESTSGDGVLCAQGRLSRVFRLWPRGDHQRRH